MTRRTLFCHPDYAYGHSEEVKELPPEPVPSMPSVFEYEARAFADTDPPRRPWWRRWFGWRR